MQSEEHLEPQSLEYQKQLIELKLSHAREVYGYASNYDNGIILAGYAAFFGLWAGTSADVTPLCRQVAAVSIGASLFCYIGWHILQMLHRQKHELAQADALVTLEANPPALFARLEELKVANNHAWAKLLKVWRPIFNAAVGLGFLGALILIWNLVARALGLPLELQG